MSEMLQKWSALKKSEQSMLIYGLLVVLLTMSYFYLWTPYKKSINDTQEKISHAREDIVWLETMSKKIKQLKTGSNTSVGSYSGSLIDVVDKSIKQNKLNEKISLLEKSGSDKVVIQFNKIPFDELIKLMGYIKKRYGILIKNIDVKRSDNDKLVNSRIILISNK